MNNSTGSFSFTIEIINAFHARVKDMKYSATFPLISWLTPSLRLLPPSVSYNIYSVYSINPSVSNILYYMNFNLATCSFLIS